MMSDVKCDIEEMIGYKVVEISDRYLLGMTLEKDGVKKEFYFKHSQECCEDVWLEDIGGDPSQLIGKIINNAYKETEEYNGNNSFCMYTFYNIQTSGGDLSIRFNGESNGYYSVDVDIYKEGI
jgi:hypothetical protein